MRSHLSCVFRPREEDGHQVNIRLMRQPRLRGCRMTGPPSCPQARLPIARGREPWTAPGRPGAWTGRAQAPDVVSSESYWQVTKFADRLA